GVLVAGTAGIVVNAAATDVGTLRGLDIDGLGGFSGAVGTKGIQSIQAARVVVEDCEIFGFGPRGISVEPSTNPVQVYISRTRLKAAAANGIVVQPASPSIRAQVTLNNVEIAESANFGLSITGGGSVVVRDSAISDNGTNPGFADIRVDGTG